MHKGFQADRDNIDGPKKGSHIVLHAFHNNSTTGSKKRKENFLVFLNYFVQISTNKMCLLSHCTSFKVQNKTKMDENGVN